MNQEFSSLDGSIKKIQREILTPYRVAVVVFIKSYCSDTLNKTIDERKDFCTAALKLIQSPDLDRSNLFKLINSSEYSLSRYSIYLDSLLDAMSKYGVKELLDLFDNLGELMKPKVSDNPYVAALNKYSILGLYVRRAIITFEKLSFYKVVALYEDLKVYINSHLNDTDIPMETSTTECNFLPSGSVWGGRQAELLVAQQAHALLTDEHKALPPIELNNLIEDLLRSSPYYAEAHYLAYLNYVRIREYFLSLNSLYHCFDRLAPLDSRSEDKLRTFRYAALNLAALYAQFEFKKLAKRALKEAIMLAQEAGDNVCLQLAHSWVYYLEEDQSVKGPLIERSVAKATELGMSHTASLALIASAHHSAMEGEKPQIVFETLMKSDVLNNQHSMTDLMSMMYAEKAALWAYYGKTEMASVCAQLLLLFNSGEKKQLMFNGSSTCQAVVTVANVLHEMGEYSLANTVLEHAKERFPNQPSRAIWALAENLHKFFRLLRDEKWYAAFDIAEGIACIDVTESKFRQIEALHARHEWQEAKKIAYALDKDENLNAQQKIRLKLAICQIKLCSDHAGTPMSATSSVLPLCNALDLAKKNHLSYYEALISMHIANVQLLLRFPSQALRNCNAGMLTILAHGGLFDQARAHVTYAKCLAATAKHQKSEKNRETLLIEGIQHLEKSRKLLEKLEANDRLKTTLYLLSLYHHELDNVEERNKYAYQFRLLDEQFPTEKNHMFIF